MVDPKGLRLGNLLRWGNMEAELIEIRQGEAKLISCDAWMGDILAEYHELNPIPLTEEWLTKLGFEKDYDGTYTIQFGRKAFRICPAEDNYMLYQHDVGLRWCPIHDGPDHVHQLQNLYFALTGEELTTLKEWP